METNKQLTEYDIDCITVMMVEAVHIAERCIQMTELYYAEQLRKSQQYEAIRRTQGTAAAEQAVQNWCHKTFRRETKWSFNTIVRCAQSIYREVERMNSTHLHTEPLTIPKDASPELRERLTKEHAERISKTWQEFDALSGDTSKLMYLIALFSNLTQEQELKIMSTLKLYQATGTGHVSPAVIDRLAERVGR